ALGNHPDIVQEEYNYIVCGFNLFILLSFFEFHIFCVDSSTVVFFSSKSAPILVELALLVSAIGFDGYEKRLEISFSIIIKTCGTTKLLLSIPPILGLANNLSLIVSAVRYTRGVFIYPGEQRFSHRSFTEEIAVLDSYFGKIGSGRCAYFLDKDQALIFYKSKTSSAANILPSSEINDFEFDPCGYSMNAIEGGSISKFLEWICLARGNDSGLVLRVLVDCIVLPRAICSLGFSQQLVSERGGIRKTLKGKPIPKTSVEGIAAQKADDDEEEDWEDLNSRVASGIRLFLAKNVLANIA
ncbi:hypothetical protein GIB67_021889, partial [Kingdonia uniflora]